MEKKIITNEVLNEYGSKIKEYTDEIKDRVSDLEGKTSDLDQRFDDKQDKLTSANAGNNITITEEGGVTKINSIGGGGGADVEAGTGIEITEGEFGKKVINVDTTAIATNSYVNSSVGSETARANAAETQLANTKADITYVDAETNRALQAEQVLVEVIKGKMKRLTITEEELCGSQFEETLEMLTQKYEENPEMIKILNADGEDVASTFFGSGDGDEIRKGLLNHLIKLKTEEGASFSIRSFYDSTYHRNIATYLLTGIRFGDDESATLRLWNLCSSNDLPVDLNTGDDLITPDGIKDYWFDFTNLKAIAWDADSPDVTDYAKVNASNTFTAKQTFNSAIDIYNATSNVHWQIIGSQWDGVYVQRNNANLYVFETTGFNPTSNNARDLGTASLQWQDLYLGRYLKLGGFVDSVIKPRYNNTYDLGTSANAWKNLYLSGGINLSNSNAVSSSNKYFKIVSEDSNIKLQYTENGTTYYACLIGNNEKMYIPKIVPYYGDGTIGGSTERWTDLYLNGKIDLKGSSAGLGWQIKADNDSALSFYRGTTIKCYVGSGQWDFYGDVHITSGNSLKIGNTTVTEQTFKIGRYF